MSNNQTNRSAVTQADIVRGLTELGLENGDTVLVHSSMKSFGYVEGGPDAVIEALLEVIGPRGCLVMPTLTMGAAENPVIFDVRTSPSVAGLVTEVFRNRPQVRRSHHPLSSAAAEGWAAEEMIRYHTDTPADLPSPYGQVYLRGGWCLFLGAPWDSNTMFHVAEELVMAPYLHMAQFRDGKLIDEHGVTHIVTFRRYNCYQTGVIRDLNKMGARYEAAGVVRRTRIGASDCRMIRASDVVGLSVDLLKNDLEHILSYTSDNQ